MTRGTRNLRAVCLLTTLACLACGDTVASSASEPGALALALAPQAQADPEVARRQQQVREDPRSARSLERLGWTFIERARSSEDPGYYALAEQTARALAPLDRDAGSLLLAHALHGQHRFAEALAEARGLAERRDGPFAWAVLGDALFDQGRIDEAAEAYERSMALRPDAQAFARFAEVLFVRGDLAGATEAMWRSARSTSPRTKDVFAWTRSRLAGLLLAQGGIDAAEALARSALRVAPESIPALGALGAVQISRSDYAAAAVTLRAAVSRSERPQLLWSLAEALRGSGATREADEVEARLLEQGARFDPRGFAVYLASRGQRLEEAVRLARVELDSRRDVFSLGALAWCEHAVGNVDVALELARAALAQRTRDARLSYHAAVIAVSAGAREDAAAWLAQARAALHMLLPSEREGLAAAERRFSTVRG